VLFIHCITDKTKPFLLELEGAYEGRAEVMI